MEDAEDAEDAQLLPVREPSREIRRAEKIRYDQSRIVDRYRPHNGGAFSAIPLRDDPGMTGNPLLNVHICRRRRHHHVSIRRMKKPINRVNQ
jgi:hypothetical protein